MKKVDVKISLNDDLFFALVVAGISISHRVKHVESLIRELSDDFESCDSLDGVCNCYYEEISQLEKSKEVLDDLYFLLVTYRDKGIDDEINMERVGN